MDGLGKIGKCEAADSCDANEQDVCKVSVFWDRKGADLLHADVTKIIALTPLGRGTI
jgi:hypothetical protein